MRGRATGSRRKIPEGEKKSVLNHIKSFPRYPGFQNFMKFLHPDLTVRKMYNLYLLKCVESNTKPANEVTYRKIFKKDFNLYSHQPRDDACRECSKLNTKFKGSNDDREKSELMKAHDAHLKEADLSRKAFQQDQNLALSNPDLYFAFSFDLQKPLPYPRLTASDAYYKHSLYISNVSCHNFHDKKLFIYLWDETVADRGTKELASCILKHVENVKSEKHIVAYSNTETGIKRSVTVALTWMKIIQSPEHKVDTIDHKFISSGHTALPNEEDFEFVESAFRKSNLLFVPEECYEVIRKSKKSNVVVNEMKQEDFVSVTPLKEAVFGRVNNTEGDSVNWMEICWMRFLKSEPYKIFYKTSMESDFKVLDLQPPLGELKNLNEIQLPRIYEKRKPIAKVKYDDLMDLLVYIPPDRHNYFKSLPHKEIEQD